MTSSVAGSRNDQTLMEEKASLREELLALRSELWRQHPDASQHLAVQIKQKVSQFKDKIVAGYLALASELDPSPSLETMAAAGVTLALPVAEAAPSAMTFRGWAPDDELEPGVHGTRQPVLSSPVVVPHVLFVPLVAFDRKGHRLGMGLGYYDRTLSHLRQSYNIVAYGIGFDGQEVDRVPAGPMDQGLDGIFTPTRFIAVETAVSPS